MKRAILSLLTSIALGVSVSAQCGAPGQCGAPATAVVVSAFRKCGAANFQIAFTGVPKLGSTTFSIDMLNPPGGQVYVLFFSPLLMPNVPMPAPWGAGCFGHLNGATSIPLTSINPLPVVPLPAPPRIRTLLPIPNNTALCGFGMWFQYFIAGSNNYWTTSPGRAVIGC